MLAHGEASCGRLRELLNIVLFLHPQLLHDCHRDWLICNVLLTNKLVGVCRWKGLAKFQKLMDEKEKGLC